jgi:hypothetical protein
MSVHALMEIKWLFHAKRFPEAQACICANYFEKAECYSNRWMPTFALTKNNFLIGVSFYTKLGRWALAEIDSFAKNAFFEESEALVLLRFAEFFFEASNFHRSYADPDYIEGAIVDKTGSKLRKLVLRAVHVFWKAKIFGNITGILVEPGADRKLRF